MKKIGIIFILFGFFSSVIIFLYAFIGSDGLQGEAFDIVIKGPVYYTDDEYKRLLESKGIDHEKIKEAKKIIKEFEIKMEKAWEESMSKSSNKPSSMIPFSLITGENLEGYDKYKASENQISKLPSRIKENKVSISMRYVDCLAFSIVIFGIGLGFLLLSKKKSSHTEGGEPVTH